MLLTSTVGLICSNKMYIIVNVLFAVGREAGRLRWPNDVVVQPTAKHSPAAHSVPKTILARVSRLSF